MDLTISSGHGSLMVKVTNLWPAYRGFEPMTHRLERWYTINLLRLKCLPVSEMWNLENGSASSDIVA
ncbi:hypothetical protein TNCV_4287681 [Trichonephila clavipes]|uniref:Uncharacterized protein n=1 Tax=Trichonephila clavipes TaxID=2585209 RepID=A0A8X6S5I8_TRICX|nr:hypothetical protein TNCV_4287681 [Trichonephila clavipes]